MKEIRRDWNTKNKIIKKEPLNISQVFDEELAKLTDKNMAEVFSAKKTSTICKENK